MNLFRFSDVLRMSERNSLFRIYYACSLSIRFFKWFCFVQACSCTLLRKTSKVPTVATCGIQGFDSAPGTFPPILLRGLKLQIPNNIVRRDRKEYKGSFDASLARLVPSPVHFALIHQFIELSTSGSLSISALRDSKRAIQSRLVPSPYLWERARVRVHALF